MKEASKTNPLILLALITGIHLIILLIRDLIVDNTLYNFLLWNLFLGSAPLIVALLLRRYLSSLNVYLFVFGSFLWLLFYPNAPYMMSDLIHVRLDSRGDLIYDTLIIFSFAMLSVYYGLLSLSIMWRLFADKISHTWANLIITGCLILSSVGFYLGRVIRLNSWDLFTKPFQVLGDILRILSPTSGNVDVYIMITLFTAVQGMLWVMTRDFYFLETQD